MKTPFRQQACEYGCVPTSFINALCYLFKRYEIPPVVVQKVYAYCMDSLNPNRGGRLGTSAFAVQLLGRWLEAYRDTDYGFKVSSTYYEGKAVHFRQANPISRALSKGGVALLSVTHQSNDFHYVLAMSVADGWLHCYDPYEPEPTDPHKNLAKCYEVMHSSGTQSPNMRIACAWLNKESNKGRFHLGTASQRQCLILQRVRA